MREEWRMLGQEKEKEEEEDEGRRQLMRRSMKRGAAILPPLLIFAITLLAQPSTGQQNYPYETGTVPPRYRPGKGEQATVLKRVAADLAQCNEPWSERGDYITAECRSLHRSRPTYQSGSVDVGVSRYSPLKSFTHSFRRAFEGTPRVICTAMGVQGTNDTFAITVRRVDNRSFTANIYRVDQQLPEQDKGWRQPLIISFVAWDSVADQPAGTEFASAPVPAVHPPFEDAPWRRDAGHSAPDASYNGGLLHVRVDYQLEFSEIPRVLAAVRLSSAQVDAQATFTSTVHSIDVTGFTLAIWRVDQPWQHPSLAIDYAAWEPSLATVNDDFYDASEARPVSGVGSVTGDLLSRSPDADVQPSIDRIVGNSRKASRVLDPYTLPRAQFGTHTLRPPVPTAAGFSDYQYPDARWGGGSLAAGHGLGTRGTRLPSAVRYDLDFSFKDIYSREGGTHFNFSTPPLMIVSLRTFRNLIPEHQQPVKDTFGVSLVGVTATGFSVNVFRLDREGNQVSFDRGGRGWMQAIDIDWLAWEPWSEPHVPLDSGEGTPVSMMMKRGDVAYFRTEVTDMTHDLTLRAGSVEPPLVHLMDAPEGAAGVAGPHSTIAWLMEHATPVAGPPSNESLVLKLPSSPVNKDAHTLSVFLALLNGELIAGKPCGGGTRWTDGYSSAGGGSSPWRVPAECSGKQGDAWQMLSGGWPHDHAYVYSQTERSWYRLECSGPGCPHQLPSAIAPLQVVVSTQIAFPGALLGLARSMLGGAKEAHAWGSDVVNGKKIVRIYSTDEHFRIARYYIAVTAMTDVNFTFSAQSGRLALAGPDGEESGATVNYTGVIAVGKEYGGVASQGQWTYFRLLVGGGDISNWRAATRIILRHAQPTRELGVYLSKGNAPVENPVYPPLNPGALFAVESFGATTQGWIPQGSADVEASGQPSRGTCGDLGDIMGGVGLFGPGAGATKTFSIPRRHTGVRIEMGFVKIDSWTDGGSGHLYMDGVEIWSKSWGCPVVEKGVCIDVNETVTGNLCGDGWSDEVVSVDLTVAHTRPTVEISVWGKAGGGEQGDEWWGITFMNLSWVSVDGGVTNSWGWGGSEFLSGEGYALNGTLAPAEIADTCTPRVDALAEGCEYVGGNSGVRACTGGSLCSIREVSWRLEGGGGEYFVGVYGYNVSEGDGTLPFIIKTVVDSDQDTGFGRQPSVGVGFRNNAGPLIQTYSRTSVAHGPGISVGITGIPATFYVWSRDKYGNPQRAGGDIYQLDFTGPCGYAVNGEEYANCSDATDPAPMTHIVDLGRGEYFASYVLTRGGRYMMSVRHKGVHVRGSPFGVQMQPDAAALEAHTGAEFNASHRRLNVTVPVVAEAYKGMYTFFVVQVPDMTADLVVSVTPTHPMGEVDVLVSNTRTHPVRNAPADVQWRSEQHLKPSGETNHTIRVTYGDPLFLAGPYFIGVYGHTNTSFNIEAKVEQAARDVMERRMYGGVVASGDQGCSSDADCDASMQCISALCTSLRTFRFKPRVPRDSYTVTVRVDEASLAGLNNDNITNCSTVSVVVARGGPASAGATIIATHDSPDSGSGETNLTVTGGGLPNCLGVYTIPLVNRGCGGHQNPTPFERSAVPCTDPMQLNADLYITVTNTGGPRLTFPFTVFVSSSTTDSLSEAAESADPRPTPPRRRDDPLAPWCNSTNGSSCDNSTLVPGQTIEFQSVSAGAYAYYIISNVGPRSEVTCTAISSSPSEKMQLFMSTRDMTPSPIRASLLGWRTDVAGGASASSTPSLRAIPTDWSFREGPFYLAVWGYTDVSSYNITCSLSVMAGAESPTVRVGAQFSGSVGSEGNFSSFRLVATDSYQYVAITVSLASTSDQQPPLGIYVTKGNPSASTDTLPLCSTSASGIKRECILPTTETLSSGNTTTTSYPEAFESDGWIRTVTPGLYRGITNLKAVLNMGELYYVTIGGTGNATAYADGTIPFTLKIDSK